MSNKILRLKDVINATGLSRSSIYLLMRDDKFPQNILLGARSVGWPQSSIDNWIDSRIAASQS